MASSRATPIIPEIISDEFLAMLREHGAVEAYVFGSMTRGEERADSDLDLLVTFDPPITLFDRLDLAERLAGIAGRNVDLLEEIHPYFAPYIEPTLIPLPVDQVLDSLSQAHPGRGGACSTLSASIVERVYEQFDGP